MGPGRRPLLRCAVLRSGCFLLCSAVLYSATWPASAPLGSWHKLRLRCCRRRVHKRLIDLQSPTEVVKQVGWRYVCAHACVRMRPRACACVGVWEMLGASRIEGGEHL